MPLFRNTVYQSIYLQRKGTDSVKNVLRRKEQGFMKQNATKKLAFSTSVLDE